MTASIREMIVAQIVALLDGAGKPPGVTVHRMRTRPIEDDMLPAILVYSEDDSPRTLGGQIYKAPLTERQLVIYIECRVQGSNTSPIDQALDPLLTWAAQTMVENEKFIVSGYPDGLANGVVEEKTAWLSKEGDKVIGAASTQWIVKYRTARSDPTSRT